MIGFDTIGNATITVFDDNKPILSTDPWIEGSPYFGSWEHTYNIPEEQTQNIISSKYIWFSHGHPDHIDGASFKHFKNSVILIPDHYGDRIYNYFSKKYKCIKLKSNEWLRLSKNIRINSFSDWNQDATILIEILSKDIILNQNDGRSLGWSNTIKKIVNQYKNRFLLRLCNWGDSNMINIYDENDAFIEPYAAQKPQVGKLYSDIMRHWNCNYAIPFSSFHQYRRTDSIHMNKYITPLEKHYEGFNDKFGLLLPAYIRWDSIKETYKKIETKEKKPTLLTPEDLGDSWSDQLEKEDKILLENYFKKMSKVSKSFGSIIFNIGGNDFSINLSDRKEQIRFTAPKNSLVTAIKRETFDDMLIGNFMKTQLIGVKSLYPNFTLYVTKYSDNAHSASESELQKYFHYYKINSADYWRDMFLFDSEMYIRENFSTENKIFKAAKVLYRKLLS